MKDLEGEIARISEHEQRRIGQDLHDGICQVLAAIRCGTCSIRDDLHSKGLPEATATSEAASMLGEAIVEVRNLARGIFPFETEGEVKVSPPEVAMHLYRIAEEALSNAVKHGRARRIVVKISHIEPMLTLTVTDDGRGFAEPQTCLDGMGLSTMRYRAQLIGINPRPDGVTVTCQLPL